MSSERLTLVDVTLRDGGYANNHTFTLDSVIEIATGLEAAGITMIEIGHGFGLGAERTLGTMAHTDVEYIQGLTNALKRAKYGMFANANIATAQDIERAANSGLQFVRIGCIGFDGPHPFDEAVQLLRIAKSAGLWASINLVRSQYLSSRELELVARHVQAEEADAVYIVDTTGGALPSQVVEAVRVLRQSGTTPVGFHGHQNLDLGVANSLAAVQAGAQYVDGTLGGIGRDSGNTQLDVLVAVLDKAGWRLGVDLPALGLLTHRALEPLFNHPVGIKGDNLLLGKYDLLSHGLGLIRRVAKEYAIPEYDLLERINKIKPNFEDEATVTSIAREEPR